MLESYLLILLIQAIYSLGDNAISKISDMRILSQNNYVIKLDQCVQKEKLGLMYQICAGLKEKGIKLSPQEKTSLEKKARNLLQQKIAKINHEQIKAERFNFTVHAFSILMTPATLFLLKIALKYQDGEMAGLAIGVTLFQAFLYFASKPSNLVHIPNYTELKSATGINYLIQNLETE